MTERLSSVAASARTGTILAWGPGVGVGLGLRGDAGHEGTYRPRNFEENGVAE